MSDEPYVSWDVVVGEITGEREDIFPFGSPVWRIVRHHRARVVDGERLADIETTYLVAREFDDISAPVSLPHDAGTLRELAHAILHELDKRA